MLVTAGLTALVLGVVRTTSLGWGSRQTVATLALSAALVTWFLLHEGRVATSPVMSLRLFPRRSIWTANLVMFLLPGALFAMWFFVSLYLQEAHDYSPLRTWLAFLPQNMAIIVGAQLPSRLVLRLGPRPLLVLGGLVSSLGLILLSGLGVDTS